MQICARRTHPEQDVCDVFVNMTDEVYADAFCLDLDTYSPEALIEGALRLREAPSPTTELPSEMDAPPLTKSVEEAQLNEPSLQNEELTKSAETLSPDATVSQPRIRRK